MNSAAGLGRGATRGDAANRWLAGKPPQFGGFVAELPGGDYGVETDEYRGGVIFRPEKKGTNLLVGE